MLIQGKNSQKGLRKSLVILCIMLLLPLKCLSQTNTNGVITIGRNALYYEDYALSIQYFNQAIQAKPYLYEPYFYRAIAKYYLGDFYGAIEDCNLSIERDPFIDDTYKLRAINFIMTEQYSKAVADYRKLLGMEVENKDIWSNMVLCETQLDSFSVADKMLDTMINKWPKYTRCYILKAQIAIQNKDTLSAEKMLDRALEISPHEVDAWSAKAQLLLQQSLYPEAEEAYNKAILQKPKESGFYLNRALARYKQNNLRGAMEDYDISLDIDPDNYLGHYNRGLLKMQVGENNEAIKDFDFVLKKEPNDRLALFNRATLSELTGNYRTAIRDYTTVLEQYPNFLTGYENRARCYRALGKNKQALADERKVYIAQLDEMFGTKKNSNKYTRKQKEQDIDDYKKLVVDNDEDNLAKFYSSDYRGRIQNRDVAVAPQPMFFLTFNRETNGLSNRYNYAAFVESINVTKELLYPLYLSTRESSTSITDYEEIHAADAILQKEIAEDKHSIVPRFYHAIYLFTERNYEEALENLDKVLEQAPNHIGALFLRATIREHQVDIASRTQQNSKTTPSQKPEYDILIQAAIKDLSQAIEADNSCPYIYYNRGCLYAKLKNSQRALDDFNAAIQLNKDLGEAYYNRGLLQIEMGKMQEGIEDLSKAGENGLYSAYSLIKHFRKKGK